MNRILQHIHPAMKVHESVGKARGRVRRGRPQGVSQAPPVFDEQAFAEAVGVAAAPIA